MKPKNITVRTIDDLSKIYPIVKFPKKENIVILKIHKTIKQRKTIKQCIKIEWIINNKRFEMCDILLAVNRGLIKEIYELDHIQKSPTGKNRKILHVIKITNNKLRKKYIDHLIPSFYRKKGHLYPVRYNYNI